MIQELLIEKLQKRIADLEAEIESKDEDIRDLEDKIESLERNIEENYKPISKAEQYDMGECNFH